LEKIVEKPNQSTGGCFIATAVYGNTLDSNVILLKQFRDAYLLPSAFGRLFVHIYYNFSPPIADHLQSNHRISNIVRKVIVQPIANLCRLILK